MTEQESLIEQQPEPEKEPTPLEWLENYEKLLIEVTGSGLYTDGHGVVDPDTSTRDAALVLIAMRLKGSIKDDVLRTATGLSLTKIQSIKHNMRKYGMLHSHQGVRNPTVEFQDWAANGLEGIMAFTLDAMVAAGNLARIKVDANGSQL